MRPCVACSGSLEEVLDLGPQPVLNRYPRTGDEGEPLFPFSVWVCVRCGLVQLGCPVPPDEVRPRVPWISYREPSRHLDAVVAEIAAGAQGPTGRSVLGLTEHDRPVVSGLVAAGWQGRMLDWRSDLGIDAPHAGTETLQGALTESAVPGLQQRDDAVDVLVARSLIEHAHDVPALLRGLTRLVRPGGLVVFEAPDCEPMLDAGDASGLWEEHVSYFTESTLVATLRAWGIDALSVWRAADAKELVCLGRVDGLAPEPASRVNAVEVSRGRTFGARLRSATARWREVLGADRAPQQRIGLLGAGHAGAMFINAHGLGPAFACAIDDDPNKQSLSMPGSRIPIVPTATAFDGALDICVLAVNPEGEDRIVDARRSWEEGGGRFLSVDPHSRRYGAAEAVVP
jgi:hypothetical protein